MPEIRTRVVAGSYDLVTPPGLAEEMAEKIPGSVPHVIPGTGPLSPLEGPWSGNELLRQWLDESL